MFKRRETIFFIILTIGIIIFSILQLNGTFFIYGLTQLALYFLFFCTIIYSLYRLAKDKRNVPLFDKAKPLLFSVLLIAFLALLSFLIDTDGGKKRLMTGGASHDPSFINFQLFRDNTFKLLNSGPFGGTFYRGTYTLKGDTLILNNDSLKHLYPTLKLLLKNTEKEKYFESIDTQKYKERLYISKDLRK